jgi:hypothetical protein
MSEVKLTCGSCFKKFNKNKREYDRQIRKGRKEFFCSRSCWGTQSNFDFPRSHSNLLRGRDQKDEFIAFRWFINRANYRHKNTKIRVKLWGRINITTEYLKDLWNKQNGKCLITGWKLVLPENGTKGFINTKPENASLDRIDNGKGYVQGNVRFICLIANLARSQFSDDELRKFCSAVVRFDDG